MWVRTYSYWDTTMITMKISRNDMHKGKTQANIPGTLGLERE